MTGDIIIVSGVRTAIGTLGGARKDVAPAEPGRFVKGLKPRARIPGWGHAGVEPSLMGIGPLAAVPVALARAGFAPDQIDVIEANEAFDAQACTGAKEPGFDPGKTNPNGSGISSGHPVGATGAVITVTLLHEPERSGGRYGLATICIGGGQGIALIIARLRARGRRGLKC